MNTIRLPRHVPALILLATLLSSCASKPQAGVTSSLHLAGKADIARFGSSIETNPYIAPRSIIRGDIDTFVVLEIELNLPEGGDVRLSGQINDTEGKQLSSIMSRDELADYRSIYVVDSSGAKGLSNLRRSYIPSDDFAAPRGYSRYFAVIRVKASLAGNAMVHAELAIDGGEPIVLDEAIELSAK